MKKIFSLIAALLLVGVAVAQPLDRSIRPSAAPAKEIQIKDAKIFTLSNGLKVFVVEDHKLPTVFYSLSLDIRPALEGDKAGLESVFSSVMGTATKTRNKEQINNGFDLIGASFSINSRGGYATGLKKHETKMLELLSDALLNPVFNQDEIDLNVGKEKTGLASIGDDGSQITKRVSAALLYGKNHPYGELESVETLDNIKLADLQSFYNSYFAPNVARLVIVGDITEKEAKANAEKYFGKWQKKNVVRTQYTTPKAPAGNKVAMVIKDGSPQSYINVAYPIEFKVGVADFLPAQLADHFYGGGMSSLLFQNLREKRSYTYGVYSSLNSSDVIGSFGLTAGRGDAASVKAGATDTAIYEILLDMTKMGTTPVTAEQLANAKASFAGSFGRSLESASTIASFATNIDRYGLPKDYYKNYLKRLDAVTVADVQAAAKKYLLPGNAWIIVVGDKSHAEGLKQFAADKTVQFFDMNGNPVEAPKAKTAEGVTAEKVIDNYVAAIGGKAAVENVNDFALKASISAMGQKMELIQLFKKPNKVSVTMTMSGMLLQKNVFDGTKLMVSGMAGSKELTEGAEFEAMKSEAAFCPEMNYAKNGYKMTVKGVEPLNGSDAYVLEVVKGATTVVEYYDVATGLKIKSVSTAETPQGVVQQISEVSDYRTVEGIKTPFVTKQTAGGMTMDMVVESVEINKGIDDAQFK